MSGDNLAEKAAEPEQKRPTAMGCSQMQWQDMGKVNPDWGKLTGKIRLAQGLPVTWHDETIQRRGSAGHLSKSATYVPSSQAMAGNWGQDSSGGSNGKLAKIKIELAQPDPHSAQ